MKKTSSKILKAKKAKKVNPAPSSKKLGSTGSGVKKPISKFLKRVISKISKKRLKKEPKQTELVLQPLSSSVPLGVLREKVAQETTLLDRKCPTGLTAVKEATPGEAQYDLPVNYGDNRIVILPRDPWWLHTYWDISQSKINEVISSISDYDQEGLAWILRVYDVTPKGMASPGGIKGFSSSGANSFFDLDINSLVNNWYINVNQPEREWCVEIGLKNHLGKFFPVARSNIAKTPYFGISSQTDEEWTLPDEEYYKILGVLDYGKSSGERQKNFEQYFRQQISSPAASWGISSLSTQQQRAKDKFFLEVATELILYGKTEPDAEVKVEGKKVKLRKDGTFSLRYALPVGDFKFEVTAVSKNKKHKERKAPAVKRYD
ncbi:MAG: DUF4912 domain-containing protein, partial [Candidatus Omnitrophica bacterium]|nr:DUF4912 domain-containing protein [Candidatus Omnitrophota bacterium]